MEYGLKRMRKARRELEICTERYSIADPDDAAAHHLTVEPRSGLLYPPTDKLYMVACQAFFYDNLQLSYVVSTPCVSTNEQT